MVSSTLVPTFTQRRIPTFTRSSLPYSARNLNESRACPFSLAHYPLPRPLLTALRSCREPVCSSEGAAKRNALRLALIRSSVGY